MGIQPRLLTAEDEHERGASTAREAKGADASPNNLAEFGGKLSDEKSRDPG